MTKTRGVIQCGCALCVAVAMAIQEFTTCGSSGSACTAIGASASPTMAQPKPPAIIECRTRLCAGVLSDSRRRLLLLSRSTPRRSFDINSKIQRSATLYPLIYSVTIIWSHPVVNRSAGDKQRAARHVTLQQQKGRTELIHGYCRIPAALVSSPTLPSGASAGE